MQIEAIPGVRCLDSAREVVNGHCGQTPKWEIPLQGVNDPTAISCSTGPPREGPGHGFSCVYGERE